MADATQLMARYCGGDADAFRALYLLLEPQLVNYLAAHARSAAGPELVQQVFLTMHRSRAAYVRGADPIPWILAIADQTITADLRAREKQTRRFLRQRVSSVRGPRARDARTS